jgi:carboxylesterase
MVLRPSSEPSDSPLTPPPAPPGSRELAERVAPLIYGHRPRPWWRWPLLLVLLGLLLTGIGLWLLRGEAERALARDLARRAPAGLWPAALAVDLGPPDAEQAVLLVHGWASCPADFAGLPERLAACGLRVRAPLLPGHGGDPRDFAALTLPTLQAFVAAEYAVLRAEYERVWLLGFSMGAALAVDLCSRLPADQQPAGLALMAPYCGIAEPRWLPFRSTDWARWLQPLLRFVPAGPEFVCLKQKSRAAEVVKYEALPLTAVALLEQLRPLVNDRERLAGLRLPVRCVISRQDTASDPAASQAAFEALGSPDKILLMVEQSDHQLLYDYDADQILDFFAQHLCPPQ